MRITKCDICKKTIKNASKSVHIGIGSIFFNAHEFCEKCGEPALKLLREKGLMNIENKKDEK